MELEPYSFEAAHDLVVDAVERSDKRHARWRMLELLYRTGSFDQAMSGAGAAGKLEFMPDLSDHVVNLVLPHLNIILASVIARDPQMVATPVGGGEQAEAHRATAEGVLDYFWRRVRATREVKDATWDMTILGNGFVKLGWLSDGDEEELEDWEVKERALDMVRADRHLATLEGREPIGIEEAVEEVPSTEWRPLQDEPFVHYASPYDVFVPRETRRIEDARWVCHRVTVPMDEVLANPEFNVTEEELKRDATTSESRGDKYLSEWRRQTEEAKGIQGSTAALDTVTLYEFYDMRARRLMVFQIHGTEPIYDDELPYLHRYPPFVHMRNYNANGHSFWAFGDLENVATVQNLINEFMTEQVENARRAGQKYMMRSELATPDVIDALESSDGDTVVGVEAPNGEPLENLVVPVMREALSGDVYRVTETLEIIQQKILGINDFQAGGVGADRMSATAAAVVDGVATLRAQDKIAQVEDATAQIGQQLLLLCQEKLDVETAVRISKTRDPVWIDVTRDDIWGEFLVTVEGGSTKAVNPATREQQGLRMLSEIVPLVAELGFDPIPAARMALRNLDVDPDAVFVPIEPDSHWAEMQGGGPEGPPPEGQPPAEGEPSNGEQMENFGGPPTAGDAQAAGGPLI